MFLFVQNILCIIPFKFHTSLHPCTSAEGLGSFFRKRKIEGVAENRLIIVDSYKEALRKMAEFNLNRTKAEIIGVTGSVGKTTTKNMLNHILSSHEKLKNRVYVSQKNFE